MKSEVKEYHLKLEKEESEICDVLASMIIRELPEAEYKIWHAHPVWFIDGNPLVGYSKLKSGIRLLFWSGQSFDEPELKPEGKFKAAEKRYQNLSEINPEPLARWLSKCKTIQWDYKNIVKRKGKLERLF